MEEEITQIAEDIANSHLFPKQSKGVLETPTLEVVHVITRNKEDSVVCHEEMIAPPQGKVVLVFTDIQSSTLLWETYPSQMGSALEIHNKILRKYLKQHGGYEVKTEGDGFMIAFASVKRAVLWCLAVQQELMRATWPKDITEGSVASNVRVKDVEVMVQQPNTDSSKSIKIMDENTLLFHGPRVRMGIHVGEPIVQVDPITGRMDYYGPMVNKSARVSGAAQGGQIVCSGDAWEEIESNLDQVGNPVIRLLGTDFKFKGLAGEETIYEILPASLSLRSLVLPIPPSDFSQTKTVPVAVNQMKGEMQKGKLEKNIEGPRPSSTSTVRYSTHESCFVEDESQKDLSESLYWSDESAFNLNLAVKEAKTWIEAVIKKEFVSPKFHESLKDGRYLCDLVNAIQPGMIPHVNTMTTPFAAMENISFVIDACKKIGIPDGALFESIDLYEQKNIRQVVLAIYYLGRYARTLKSFTGPMLPNLFQKLRCAACGEEIGSHDDYIETLSKQYHIHCASCHTCNRPVDKDSCTLRDGDVYCTACGSGEVCAECKKGLVGMSGALEARKNTIRIGSVMYHKQCAKCSECEGLIGSQQYIAMGNGIYHMQCCCAECMQPLSAMGKHKVVLDGDAYHSVCVCLTCGQPIDGKAHTTDEERGYAFHVKCFCRRCKEHIRASYDDPNFCVTMNSKYYHRHCVCSVCNIPFEKDEQAARQSELWYHKTCICSECGESMEGCEKPIEIRTGKSRKVNLRYHPECCECQQCGDALDGNTFVQIFNDSFCPACVCVTCQKILPLETPVSQDGKRYCDGCAPEIEAKEKCWHCNHALGNTYLKAMGKKWHDGCFVCHRCENSFTGNSFLIIDQRPYCQECHDIVREERTKEQQKKEMESGVVCGGNCGKPLGDVRIKALGKRWHPECLVCTQCRNQFGDQSFINRDGMPYCHECASKGGTSMRNSKQNAVQNCAQCGKAVTNHSIKAMGKKYHPECFRCYVCQCQFEDDGFFEKGGKPHCRNCAE